VKANEKKKKRVTLLVGSKSMSKSNYIQRRQKSTKEFHVNPSLYGLRRQRRPPIGRARTQSIDYKNIACRTSSEYLQHIFNTSRLPDEYSSKSLIRPASASKRHIRTWTLSNAVYVRCLSSRFVVCELQCQI
jgi:hypothetical protein